MMYIPRASLVTAQPVEMAGVSLMVVCVGVKHEVVSADSFNRLFRLADVAEVQPAKAELVDPKVAATPHPWSKTGKAQLALRKEKPFKPVESSERSKSAAIVKQTPAAVAGAENTSELGTTETVLKAVAEAPRTTAETQDRVCLMMGWPTGEKKYRDRVYQAVWAAVKEGKIEKRTDPSTQLPRLYLKGAQ